MSLTVDFLSERPLNCFSYSTTSRHATNIQLSSAVPSLNLITNPLNSANTALSISKQYPQTQTASGQSRHWTFPWREHYERAGMRRVLLHGHGHKRLVSLLVA
ncbi:hypothetical protein ElyMa_006643200 [Elysia marginata]|uniref:Uncharacterized protein n=1 Tax=Elysia marginata TaxID=1093978 RepID=A0AAV4IEJ0_9GAST|nr:hypothetical protein ElyMa_006643200 [Elysia marginata]